MAATAAIVAALTLAVKLEPVVAEGIALLIAKIHKKKNPAAAVAKANVAVDTEPDDPNVVPLDEEWEKDV